MLLFFCADEADLPALARDGLRASGLEGVPLWTSLDAAQDACAGCLLVVDPAALPAWPPEEAEARVRVPAVPPEALRNLRPYRPPVPVTAGGGYVVQQQQDPSGRREPAVLLIFRRGVWDLPKGKQDPGETVEACALREVREEVGLHTLRLVRPLGTTVHGYPEGDVFCVKTTHWFLMHTPETCLAPQAEEGIERAAWVPWSEAQARLGYATLRRHMSTMAAPVQAEK